jgi:hypothetical protein
MCAEFLKDNHFGASQDNAQNLQKMPKLIKATKVKKYSKICQNHSIDLCFQLYLFMLKAKKSVFSD